MKKLIFLLGILICSPLQAASVCFSPGGKCDQKLIEFIQTAKKSIDVAIYSFTLENVAKALIEADTKRGIKVRVLVDEGQSAGTSSIVSELIDAGLFVRYGDQDGLMHHKFTLVDGVKLETGSFNYSSNGVNKNAENSVYLEDKDIVKAYQIEFDKLWDAGYSKNSGELITI